MQKNRVKTVIGADASSVAIRDDASSVIINNSATLGSVDSYATLGSVDSYAALLGGDEKSSIWWLAQRLAAVRTYGKSNFSPTGLKNS